MLSRLFGSKKKNQTSIKHAAPPGSNWSFLYTDMHSHLLPGVDDGAQSMEDSIQMIRELIDMGYQKIITTPHIKSDIYPNTPYIIQSKLKSLREELAAQGIHVPISAAAEYYLDERFMEMLQEGSLLTVSKNEVLIEFSFAYEPMRLSETLFRIQTKGYKPILAHPERYGYYHDKFHVYKDLKERGCLLQLNALSITGYYGRPVRETAERLLQEGLYDYCGTDMHHMRHVEGMKKIQESETFGLLYQYPFQNKNL